MFEMQRFLNSTPSAVEKVTTEGAKSQTSNIWYNLQGQRGSSPKAKGVYINGGRKIVVK